MPDFGTLKTRISNRINTTDAASLTQIGDAINSAIDFFEEKHFWFNEATNTESLIIGDDELPNIPSNFLVEWERAGLVLLDNNLSYPLQKITHEERSSIDVNTSGRPRFYDERNGLLLLYPIPDQTYSVTLFYTKSYVDLVNDPDTNDWTTNADRLIEAKALSDLYLDQRHGVEISGRYELKVQQELNALNSKSNRRRATGRFKVQSLNYGNGLRRRARAGSIFF